MAILEMMPDKNYTVALEYLKQAYAIDSTSRMILERLGQCYMDMNEFRTALDYYHKWLSRLGDYKSRRSASRINTMQRVGYCYWMNGLEEEAQYYFDLQKEYCLGIIKLRRDYPLISAYYDLGSIYTFEGENEKAFKNLRMVNQYDAGVSILLWWLKNDPLLDSIRNEPEFQMILQDHEVKVERTNEQVRQWLEENGML